KPWLAADRMAPLKLRDLALAPRMITVSLGTWQLAHIAGRIVRPHSDLNGVLHKRAKRLTQRIRGAGLVGASGYQLDDMLSLQQRCTFIAMLDAQPFDHAAIGGLRT